MNVTDEQDKSLEVPHTTAFPAAGPLSRLPQPHAVPFHMIFEELWARRAEDLTREIQKVFEVTSLERETLDAEIVRSTQAYSALVLSKETDLYGRIYEQGCEDADKRLLAVLHGMKSSALCFSGGGMRSASFCLGVLQGMSRFGLIGETMSAPPKPEDSRTHMLGEFDYLSTVSGGGYIGSWLMAWTKRVYDPPKQDADNKMLPPQQPKTPAQSFHDVLTALAGKAPHTSGDPAPRPVRHLREYTSFLAPAFGLTLDMWTLGAIVFRNLFINWVMIFPLFLCLIAAVQVCHFGVFSIATRYVQLERFVPSFILATFFFIIAGLMAGFRMPSRQAERLFAAKLEPKTVFFVFLLPLGISTVIILALWLQMGREWGNHPKVLIAWFAAAGFISFSTIPIVRTLITWKKDTEHSKKERLIVGLFAASVAALLLALTLFGLGVEAAKWAEPVALIHRAEGGLSTKTPITSVNAESSAPSDGASNKPASMAVIPTTATSGTLNREGEEDGNKPRPEVLGKLSGATADLFIIFGFPLVWWLLMGASSLFSAFLSDYEDDIDREWWGRAGGMMMSTLALWTIAQAVVIYAPHIFRQTISVGKLSSAGFITGLLGAMGGFGSANGAGGEGKKADLGAVAKFLNRFALLLPALCCAALLVLALLIANFEIWLAEKAGSDVHSLRAHVFICLGAAIIALVANWAININIFSLHGMYRMRLMRAFLGSSNTLRNPDSFTGFDDRDLVWENEVPYGPGVPLHIINATVNLVGTKDPAWAQRKAEGFTISPLFCGGWRLGYVRTSSYGGPRGLSLATAMAISGAAFNPNMGYHSSPLVTLIMTLFNVRLGWWLPNPKYQRGLLSRKIAQFFNISMDDLMKKKSPRLALRPLMNEMLGGTDDTTPYIELSDGGHFENLGLYEMVLRRCSRIVVIDAGADPSCQFEDLGNAIRKIEIDLGVAIEFRGNKLGMQPGPVESNVRCAIADIRYDCVDGSCPAGTLIYIKAGLNGTEPPDVLQYSRTHPTFPHEATANQFFTESQFESYRHLGSFVFGQIVDEPGRAKRTAAERVPRLADMQAFFEAANQYVSKADAAKAAMSSRGASQP